MNKQIHDEILKIEAKGLSDIELLALVTDTSYEVVFYAKYDGKMRQSNDLAEDGILTLDFEFLDIDMNEEALDTAKRTTVMMVTSFQMDVQ